MEEQEQQDTPVTKKERSAAHPALNIDNAIAFVSEVYKNFRLNFTKRDDIISLIEGAHPRHLAAASYYGFIQREKDSYKVDDKFKSIISPVFPNEKEVALLEAIYKPTLNKELIDKFDGHEFPDESKLIAHLTRFYRITDDAAPNAAYVFITSAQFCGILGAEKILNYKKTVDAFSGTGNADIIVEGTDSAVVIEAKKTVAVSGAGQQAFTEIKQQPLLLPEMTNEEKVRVRLTENKFAYIIHPLDITKKDITILRKQLDVLEELIT